MVGKPHMYKGNRISPSQLIMMIELAERPMYGYELIKVLREEYDGVWVPKTGAVYPALRRLQEHGLLTVRNIEGKDHYSLSPEGQAWLDETLAGMTSQVLFMARTTEIIGRAYLRRKGKVEEFIPPEERPPEVLLEELREVRKAMLANLAMLAVQIEELEGELGKEGEG